MNPDIDISANNEGAFRWSGYYGELKVVKWLLKVKPDINVFANKNYAFRMSYEIGHLKVAKLLLQHKTQNYYMFAKKNKIYNKKQQIAKQI